MLATILAFIATLIPQERCMPVDPGALVYSDTGVSVPQGDGHVYVPPGRIVYHHGPPVVCMPLVKGMMKLYLPKPWLTRAQAARPRFSVLPVHNGYEKWMQPPRPLVSCCNDRDCEPVEGRYDEHRRTYQAKIEGQWVDIPDSIILDRRNPDNASPDGSFHACWDRGSKELLCFREAEPKI